MDKRNNTKMNKRKRNLLNNRKQLQCIQIKGTREEPGNNQLEKGSKLGYAKLYANSRNQDETSNHTRNHLEKVANWDESQ